jgi:hypothetical protein
MTTEELNPIKFDEYLKLVKESKNPVAALTWAFERLHTLSDVDQDAHGRIARIWTLAHKDTGFLMKLIWNTASDGIAGSHLGYLQASVSKKFNGYAKPMYPLGKSQSVSGHAGMDVVK